MRYAEYSSSTYCWNEGMARQWVTSFSFFWPAKSEVGGGGAAKSTRNGGKSQTSSVRRVIPRKVSRIGRVWPLGSVSVPEMLLSFWRLRIRVLSGAWIVRWTLSADANSGFSPAAAAGAASISARQAKTAAILMKPVSPRCAE